MALSLSDWDSLVGQHLQEIEYHASRCEDHAKRLFAVPDWETKAEDRLERTEELLTCALARIVAARVTMREKAHDN
jgi:hypothetical protein